jgi:hypothetical protein
MTRRPDQDDDLDDLDRLLNDPDLLGDDEEIELLGTEHASRASPEMVRAVVDASPTLTESVRDARAACRTARDALRRARDEVDRGGAVEDSATLDLLAWLACMDELVKFADGVGELLGD